MVGNISRRNLLTASGVTLAGIAGASALSGCAKDDASKAVEIAKAASLSNKWENSRAVLIGDSITDYDMEENSAGVYVVGYASFLKAVFKQVDNEAIAGACIAYHQESKYEDVSTTVDKVNFGDYDFCMIAAGINDCEYWSSQMGELRHDNFDKTKFFGGYQYILNKIYKDNPGIQILILTPLKSAKTSAPNYINSAGHVLADYVEAIRKIAEAYSIPTLDLYEEGGFNTYTFDKWTADGLHPTTEGYKMLASKLIVKITSI